MAHLDAITAHIIHHRPEALSNLLNSIYRGINTDAENNKLDRPASSFFGVIVATAVNQLNTDIEGTNPQRTEASKQCIRILATHPVTSWHWKLHFNQDDMYHLATAAISIGDHDTTRELCQYDDFDPLYAPEEQMSPFGMYMEIIQKCEKAKDDILGLQPPINNLDAVIDDYNTHIQRHVDMLEYIY